MSGAISGFFRSLFQPGLGSPAPDARPATVHRLALGCGLFLAASLRFFVARTQPNIIWPDEIFQVLEPAHRLVYGGGPVAWEFIVGLRSWLFPGVIAAMVWLGRFLGPDPALQILPVQLFMIGASLVPVAVAWRWGERVDGLRGGAIVGGLAAVWVDLVFIAAHPLTDVIASDVLMAGLYAALPLTTIPGLRRSPWPAALFGLALALRIQLGPALLVAALYACGRRPRAWLAVAGGGAIVLAASGCLDWATLGTPFQSIWLDVWLNLFKGLSDFAGTQPLAYYIGASVQLWGLPASLLLVYQFIIGRRRFAALFWTVVTLFVTLTILTHKEPRYFFPAIAPIITLCGLVTIDAVRTVGDFLRRHGVPASAAVGGALALWSSVSLLVAQGGRYAPNWTNKRELVDAFALAARQPGLCGVGLLDISWVYSPGSAALPPGVPFYVGRIADVPHDAPGFNVAIADRTAALPGALYHRAACFEGSEDPRRRPFAADCVWVRSGPCAPGVALLPSPNWPPYFLDSQDRLRRDRVAPYAHGRPF